MWTSLSKPFCLNKCLISLHLQEWDQQINIICPWWKVIAVLVNEKGCPLLRWICFCFVFLSDWGPSDETSYRMHSDHGSVLSAWPLLFHTTGADPSNQSLQLEVTLSSCSVFFLLFLIFFLGFFLLSSFRSYFESSQFLLLNVLLKCLTPTRSKVLRCWRTNC